MLEAKERTIKKMPDRVEDDTEEEEDEEEKEEEAGSFKEARVCFDGDSALRAGVCPEAREP